MPHLDPVPHYRIVLTSDELRLILLGLAGMIKDRNDKAAATRLNLQLCQQRAKFLADMTQAAETTAENAKKLLPTEEASS